MYKVKVFPNKCSFENSWIHKELTTDDIIHISESQYNYHKRHNCMKVLKHYRMVTVSKKKCSKCGQWIIKRKAIKWQKK